MLVSISVQIVFHHSLLWMGLWLFEIHTIALIFLFLISILVVCICGSLLCTRGDPWEEEMDVNTGSIIEPKSITNTLPVSSIGELDASGNCRSCLPPIDDDLVRVMKNDPSGGIVLDRMDRATAEALAVERILKEGQSSPIFKHLSLPLPSEVRVVASKRDFL
ncbi:hypothetical protein PRIPAC_80766 [Pristionchus pacificus]|uniref:Uncharacterized protein n=1 Tax=Pristionchus pacificus TaxID=54126 RepID=A0A8R1V540_PRIPA|nr:hypothetical protein PRIPAC_80766 [Pristionchus pacificus]